MPLRECSIGAEVMHDCEKGHFCPISSENQTHCPEGTASGCPVDGLCEPLPCPQGSRIDECDKVDCESCFPGN